MVSYLRLLGSAGAIGAPDGEMKPKHQQYRRVSDGLLFFNMLSRGHFGIERRTSPHVLFIFTYAKGTLVTMHTGARISLGLAVLLTLLLRPGAAPALEHQSARISSLGGDHVVGVIPDFYTDIGVNPAYAFFAGRLNVGYARRRIPSYAPSVPYLMEGSGSYPGSSLMVNELSAWGIRLSSWRTAVFAQWALYRPESVSSYPNTGFDNQAYSELREDWESSNNDFARIDLVAARALGDRYALGLRLQGRVYNHYASSMRKYGYEGYYDRLFVDLYNQRRETQVRSFAGRRYSLDLQAGVVKSDDTSPRTDLAIKASLNRPDYRQERYELDISKDFDQAGALNEYSYYRYYWNDARKGDIWSLALTFRHSFDGGIRVLAGGDISTCSYETEWSNSEERLAWGWTDTNWKVAGAFDGDGTLLDGSCFFKGGKVFGLHRTTDLYLGLHGVFSRARAKEEPLAHYAIATDGEESTVRFDQANRLESTETLCDLFIPFSVEFRPSSYFTYYSSFILYAKWRKLSTAQPFPSLFTFRPPASVSRLGSARLAGTSSQAIVEPAAYSSEWERDLATGYAVTLGFSLHYRDRFFVDVYTQSEMIPLYYFDDNVIDIRYVF
jgi:hypothetical protein